MCALQCIILIKLLHQAHRGQRNCVQIGFQVVLAASHEERAAASSTVHVAVASDGRICGVLKAGRRMLAASVLQQLLTATQRAGRELFAALQPSLDADMA